MAGYYELLGVPVDATESQLRAAYRELARRLHPDQSGDASLDAQRTMAVVNQAWVILSDPRRRAEYDRSASSASPERPESTATAERPFRATGSDRTGPREQWFLGLSIQIRRLSAEAARSSAMALSMRRRGRQRSSYEAQIPAIVDHLGHETEQRVREARVLGSAPLDLALTAILIGLRSLAVELGRAAAHSEVTLSDAQLVQAEMVDRMWDTVAHELRHDIVQGLGGNPHIHRWVVRHP